MKDIYVSSSFSTIAGVVSYILAALLDYSRTHKVHEFHSPLDADIVFKLFCQVFKAETLHSSVHFSLREQLQISGRLVWLKFVEDLL